MEIAVIDVATTKIDFDRLIERRGSDSTKWAKYSGRDILPMWVADMDFASPPEVITAVKKRLDHGVLGYSVVPDNLVATVVERLAERHRWVIEPEWLVWLPGVVPALNLACRAVGQPGDSVVTFTPVYHPFLSAPGLSQRRLIKVPLTLTGVRYGFDLDALAAAVTPQTRLLLLCNPHNPVGRVQSAEELAAIAEFCLARDIVICSDEIHCDLILEPHLTHISTATLDESVAANTITLLAPSKTFNTAGLSCAFAVIPNSALRERFEHAMRGIKPEVNPLSYHAALAAYRHGEPWRQALITYLRGNRDFLAAAAEKWPDIRMLPLEATYLAWLDVAAMGLSDPQAAFEAVGVGPSPGAQFDDNRFLRLNFGCPRATLAEAVRRIGRLFSH